MGTTSLFIEEKIYHFNNFKIYDVERKIIMDKRIIIARIIKCADILDNNGLTNESDQLTKIANDLMDEEYLDTNHPVDKPIYKDIMESDVRPEKFNMPNMFGEPTVYEIIIKHAWHPEDFGGDSDFIIADNDEDLRQQIKQKIDFYGMGDAKPQIKLVKSFPWTEEWQEDQIQKQCDEEEAHWKARELGLS